ncbi:MAG TPA: hypothetical protein VNA25_23215 [Phycisphaerae bacterium]|nr:hypothetical protein [Phycisphaerae bacterium]
MDKKHVIAWLIPIVVRGIAWVLAAKLGLAAAESQDLATQIGGALGALVLAGGSIYSSVRGRKVLLATKPPEG